MPTPPAGTPPSDTPLAAPAGLVSCPPHDQQKRAPATVGALQWGHAHPKGDVAGDVGLVPGGDAGTAIGCCGAAADSGGGQGNDENTSSALVAPLPPPLPPPLPAAVAGHDVGANAGEASERRSGGTDGGEPGGRNGTTTRHGDEGLLHRPAEKFPDCKSRRRLSRLPRSSAPFARAAATAAAAVAPCPSASTIASGAGAAAAAAPAGCRCSPATSTTSPSASSSASPSLAGSAAWRPRAKSSGVAPMVSASAESGSDIARQGCVRKNPAKASCVRKTTVVEEDASVFNTSRTVSRRHFWCSQLSCFQKKRRGRKSRVHRHRASCRADMARVRCAPTPRTACSHCLPVVA